MFSSPKYVLSRILGAVAHLASCLLTLCMQLCLGEISVHSDSHFFEPFISKRKLNNNDKDYKEGQLSAAQVQVSLNMVTTLALSTNHTTKKERKKELNKKERHAW